VLPETPAYSFGRRFFPDILISPRLTKTAIASRMSLLKSDSFVSRFRREEDLCFGGFFSVFIVNHVDGLWLGSPNEHIYVQQQNRLNIGDSFPA